jgi:methionyl-tRNA formyltransferase
MPPPVLELPTVAPVNLHFSLLPELRGAAPVQRAILHGLTATGVTTMRMDQGMDTGPILLQADTPIGPDEQAGPLGDRLAELGADLLVRTLDGLAAGSIGERRQDDAAATYAPKLTARDRVVDWSRSSEEILRLIRALAPHPAAVTTFRRRNLKILRASAASPAGGAQGRPGTLLESAGRPVVTSGDGLVVLDEVQPEGGRAMAGEAFLRGRRPQPDERLGQGPEGPGGRG